MADLIDRQAAIDALDSINCCGWVEDSWEKVCSIIEHVPSAQQDTPTVTYVFGKWIEKEDDGYHGGGYTECSVCGQRYSWGGYFEANGFRYCPRCGHRMEVVE